MTKSKFFANLNNKSDPANQAIGMEGRFIPTTKLQVAYENKGMKTC